MTPFKLNVFSGNLDIVLGMSTIFEGLSGNFLMLDTSNDPLTGELVIDPASGDTALDVKKGISLKAGQKLIVDGD